MKKMKNIKFNYLKIVTVLVLVFSITISCDRDLSDDAQLAGFSKNGEVFLDGFTGGLDYFPFAGSYQEAFSVDQETKYKGTAAMRFDVPNVGDPLGAYAGAIFRLGTGRDLSGYDALTFWAKGTRSGSINEIGFGQDFEANKYLVTTSLQLTTNWRKYVIPIPDATKLIQERGMFWYAEGPENGEGYSFWIDELQFENLGTIAQPRPEIFEGEDLSEQTFIGSARTVNGLRQTFNMGSGLDQTVVPAPGYFEFTSSNTSVATVNDLGQIAVIGTGTAVITAVLGGVPASGSLTLESLGEFTPAPIPTRDPSNVISIFSDAYTNVPVDFYNGYFAPFQTTQGQADININGDNIIKYTQLNFVASEFKNPTVNASQMTHLHVDIQVENPINSGDFIRLQLGDFGPNGVFDGGGDDSNGVYTITQSSLSTGNWLSFDIPLSSFAGLVNRNNLAQLFFITDGTNPSIPGSITDILVDNIYFYRVPSSPTIAAPTPTLPAANVVSLFSDAYTNVPVDTWRTSWSSAATVFEDLNIAGNATKKYTNLGFVGIETTTTTVNASNMTNLHLDVWSSTFTSFSIKLVDFGPNGVFGGGDDSEHQIDFANPNRGQWVSYDIPLSSFTGLTSTGNIAQYILVAAPFGATNVFIDNMYFHN